MEEEAEEEEEEDQGEEEEVEAGHMEEDQEEEEEEEQWRGSYPSIASPLGLKVRCTFSFSLYFIFQTQLKSNFTQQCHSIHSGLIPKYQCKRTFKCHTNKHKHKQSHTHKQK